MAKKLKAVGHVRIMATGITINGKRLNDVNLDTDILEGESIYGAIGRAHFEKQQAAKPKPATSKVRRKRPTKPIPDFHPDGRAGI
jgi:hypothetical protein